MDHSDDNHHQLDENRRSLHVFFPEPPSSSAEIEKEHMFDKTVTPSDVGKLNRLVIPKQHAERFFPLDASSNEKGLLLNFEDRDGKEWRFRYSYWNSSQSYVMTKGWSRFVKEKRLDAGDTVSFSRGLGDASRDRLFIDWKRRPLDPGRLGIPSPYGPMMSFATRAVVPWSGFFVPPPHTVVPPMSLYDHQHPVNYGYNHSSSYLYHLRSSQGGTSHVGVQYGHGGGGGGGSGSSTDNDRVFVSVPETHNKGVWLFGVNLDHPHLELSLGGSTSTGTASDAEFSGSQASGKQPMVPDLGR